MLIFLLKKSGYRPYTVYRGAVLNNTASGCKLGVYPDTVPSKYLEILEHTAKLYWEVITKKTKQQGKYLHSKQARIHYYSNKNTQNG